MSPLSMSLSLARAGASRRSSAGSSKWVRSAAIAAAAAARPQRRLLGTASVPVPSPFLERGRSSGGAIRHGAPNNVPPSRYPLSSIDNIDRYRARRSFSSSSSTSATSSCWHDEEPDDDREGSGRDDDGVDVDAPAGGMTTAASSPPLPGVQKYRQIDIRYASQGGTAQLFAMQLAEAVEDRLAEREGSGGGGGGGLAVVVRPCNQREDDGKSSESDPAPPIGALDPSRLHVFLLSTTGIGDPPDNGRELYEWLMKQEPSDGTARKGGGPRADVAVFGLGNQVAHPSHYNVVGKNVYDRLVNALGCTPVVPLGLGDDGDCIEDDFDGWMQLLMDRLFEPDSSATVDSEPSDPVPDEPDFKTQPHVPPRESDAILSSPRLPSVREGGAPASAVRIEACPGSVSGTRRVSAKYPTLELEASVSSVVRTYLPLPEPSSGADAGTGPGAPSPYPHGAKLWNVVENRGLNPDPAANGMREMVLELSDGWQPTSTGPHLYESGDHMVVYPRNPDCVVEAYLQLLDDVSPHAVIRGIRDPSPSERATGGGGSSSSRPTAPYPYPFGLTVYETLSHCVDLSAVPSPALARFILNRKDIEYKNDVSKPRRTVLTLLRENNVAVSLEDVLYALSPIQGRFYSISSSPLKHPDRVRLLYRPVRYVSGRGYLREGLCSTYLMMTNETSRVVARINSNPSFRLPADPTVPVVILAGGCGVAPFRAFLEERQALQEGGEALGECHLFVGFRNPADAAWTSLMRDGLRTGALTQAHVSYGTGVPNPSPLLTSVFRDNSQKIWDLIHGRGGHLYICGGAQSFGAAVKRELIGMVMENGDGRFGTEAATAYLQDLSHGGRLCEDLAD